MRKNHPEVRSSSIKLSIATQFYPPDYAATGQLIEELAHQLGQQGIQVKVFTGQPGYAFQNESAPNVESFDYLTVNRSRTSRLWAKRIRGKAINGFLFCLRTLLHFLNQSNRGDILLLTTAPPYLPALGYFIHLLFGAPYICLIYDLHPDIAVQLNVVSPQHWLIHLWTFLNKKTWEHAQELIVLSSTMRDRVAASCPTAIDKISVIHNWADPNKIVPIAKEHNWFAKTHNLTEKFTVLYSGNMGRCHDMDTILATAIQLKDEPIQFVFIGDGAKRQEFIDRVDAIELSNCRFLPYQSQQVLPYSLTACDLTLVSISTGMEGLVAPSKFYSSLATGRPVAVICEAHSYLRPILTEANCGKAFAHSDSASLANFIRWLANHPEIAHQMGKAGRLYLRSHFTPEIIAQQYSQVIRRDVRRQQKRSLRRIMSPNKANPVRL